MHCFNQNQDHLQEIVDKWLAIDDEIWAKIICMERNRRIAKAYARKRSLTVNGSEDEYLDGTTLGLNSFDNPDRDIKTRHIKQYIGQGLRIKITQGGDIVVRRLSKANVYVHQLNPSHPDLVDQPQQPMVGNHQTRGSYSSSDPYALNSESGDLYGIVGPTTNNYRQQPLGHHQSNNNGSSSAFSLSGSSNSNSNGQHRNGLINHQVVANKWNKRQQARMNERPLAPSEHSSSSGGFPPSSSSSSYINGKGKLTQQDNLNQFGSGDGNHDLRLATNNGGKRNLAGNGGPLSSSGYSSYAETGYSTISLEYNRPVKIFDMSKFKLLLERESQRPNPNRKFLQSKCISVVSFVVDDHKVLNLPSWIMIINIVAVDLLKTELGLFGPHDMFTTGPMTILDHHPNPNRHDRNLKADAAAVDRMNRFNRNHQPHDQPIESSRPPLPPAKLPALKSRAADILNSHNNQLAASKKAFANAAALGAYNGEHYASNSCMLQSVSHLRQEFEQRAGDMSKAEVAEPGRRYGPKKKSHPGEMMLVAAKKSNSDGELQISSRFETSGGGNSNKLAAANHKRPEAQQSSSSSGFDSHCSSQNDSSAASSDSNIAQTGGATGEIEPASKLRPHSGQGDDVSRVAMDTSESSHGKADPGNGPGIQQDFTELAPANNKNQPRGLRPPKLPHRVSPPTGSSAAAAGLSAPIPIPAPPTEPSVRANLILVSPTGFSPPLPKRKGTSKLGGTKQASSCGQLDDPSSPPEFIMMNENELLLQQQHPIGVQQAQLKLPDGIPPHAQLAPPATQRHILKYLMSATAGKMGPANCARQPVPQPPPPPPLLPQSVPSNRYQRPLPVVPGGPQFMNQHDESLYYCGLQARISNRARQLQQQQQHPSSHIRHQQIQNSAINAILLEHHNNNINNRKNQQFQLLQQQHQHHQVSPYLRHQISLTNLQDPKLLRHHQMNPGLMGGDSNYPYAQGVPVGRPLMKLFKQAANNDNHNGNENSEITLNQIQTNSGRNMFSSVDNLSQLRNSQKSAPSFLSQMGLALSRKPHKLRANKTKK